MARSRPDSRIAFTRKPRKCRLRRHFEREDESAAGAAGAEPAKGGPRLPDMLDGISEGRPGGSIPDAAGGAAAGGAEAAGGADLLAEAAPLLLA